MIWKKVVLGAAPAAIAVVLVVGPAGQSNRRMFDLERNHGGFRALPAAVGGPVSIELVPDPAGSAVPVLRVAYDVKRGRLSGVMRPVNGLEGEGLWFRYRTDTAGIFVVGLTEADGSMYQTILTAPADTWEVLEVSFEELRLSDDSSDENDTLDLSEVNALIFADPSGFLPSRPERRELLLREAGIITARSGGRGVAAEGFHFGSGVDGWKAIPPPTGAPVEVGVGTPEGHTEGGALLLKYKLARSRLSGVARNVAGVKGLGVRIRLMTERPTVVVVGLVERDGSMYQRVFQTTGTGWEVFEAAYPSFALSDDSEDEDSKLALAEVGTLVIADPGGFMGASGESRSLWVDSFEFLTEDDETARVTTYRPILDTGTPTRSGARATAGVSYAPGRFGLGMEVDGPGEKAIVPAPGLRRESGTIELWIAPRVDAGGYRDFSGIVAMQAEPFVSGFGGSLLVFFAGESRIAFMMNADPGRVVASEPLSWKKDEWHHVAVSWGPRGSRLYLDGRVAARNSSKEGPAQVSPVVVVGNQAWTIGSQRHANSVVDELRISSEQRSDKEIAESARGRSPLGSDVATTALEHFDGRPAPPMTWVGKNAGLPILPANRKTAMEVTIAGNAPRSARLDYTVSRANGVEAHHAVSSVGRGTSSAKLELPPLREPGHYRVEMRLSAGGEELDRGRGWLLVGPGDAKPVSFYGSSGSYIEPFEDERFFQRAARAGVGTVRMPFEWSQIEPEDDVFIWHRYDGIVEAATREGIEVVPTLIWEGAQPGWAGPGTVGTGLREERYPPTNLDAWADFVYHVVSRYQGTIRWWIPANEPNLSRYWHPEPSPDAYVRLLEVTRKAARRADAESRLVGGSVAGLDLDYLEAIFRKGALDFVDAVGIHYYICPYDPDESSPRNAFDAGSKRSTFREGLAAARRLVERYGGDQRLWLDEAGQPYRDDFVFPHWGVQEARAASHLVKIFTESLASGAVERVLWFTLWGGEYGSFSLLRPDGSPTLPYVAFAALGSTVGEGHFVREVERGPGIRALRFESDGVRTDVVWSRGGTRAVKLEPGERVSDLFGFSTHLSGAEGEFVVTEVPQYVIRERS